MLGGHSSLRTCLYMVYATTMSETTNKMSASVNTTRWKFIASLHGQYNTNRKIETVCRIGIGASPKK